MDKSLKPSNTPNKLASVDAPVRAQLLKELPKKERDNAIANLVESAMVMGLTDVYDIRTWLGLNIHVNTVRAKRDEVKERWLDETNDIVEYAQTQRAVQIKLAWDNVRKCEDMFEEAKSTGDKVKVKQLQLQYLQYISKLTFVEDMVENNKPDTQVNVVAWSNAGGEEDG